MTDTEELFKLIDQMDARFKQVEQALVGVPCESGPLLFARWNGKFRLCFAVAKSDPDVAFKPVTECTITQRIEAMNHLPGLLIAHAEAVRSLRAKAQQALEITTNLFPEET